MKNWPSISLVACLACASISCGGGGGGNIPGQKTTPPIPQVLTITTASLLPPTVQGQGYSATLAASNGQGTLHWSIAQISPTTLFTNGLTIDPNTGALSGTVQWGGTGGFNATVTDSASPPHSATKGFSITSYLPLESGPAQTLNVSEFNTPFNLSSGIQGGLPPVSFVVSSGTMPPGLRFAANGQLSGAAYQTGTYSFTLTAQDSDSPPETANQAVTIVVSAPPLNGASTIPSRLILNRPFSGKVIPLGGISPYSFSLSNAASLPAGLSFDTSTGILSGTPTVNNSGFGGVAEIKDSSSPPQQVTVLIDFGVEPPLGRNDTPATATPITNGSYFASISPYVDPPNGVPTPGDHDYYKIVSVGGATVHLATFAKQGNINNPLDTVLEIVDANGVRLNTCRQPGDTTSTFNGACINDDISANPHVQDSALDYQVPGANNTTSAFYVHVFDWRGDARPDMVYGLNVSGVVDPLVIAPPPPATNGVAYSYQLTASHTHGTVAWSLAGGSLPPGLTLTNGVISGTATADGSYSFTLQASDAGPPAQVGTAQETMVVGDPVKITSSATFPTACLNQPYSFTMITSGGTAPLVWSFFSSNWVAVNLNQSTGTWSGTPGVAGTFTGRVGVQDAAQSSDSQQVTLIVNSPPC